MNLPPYSPKNPSLFGTLYLGSIDVSLLVLAELRVSI